MLHIRFRQELFELEFVFWNLSIGSYLPIESNSSQISFAGGAVISDTATMTTEATINAGSSS